MASIEPGMAARGGPRYPALAVLRGGEIDAAAPRLQTAAVIDLESNWWRLVV